jgi:tripartite ATP-independent transporter DctM subunit
MFSSVGKFVIAPVPLFILMGTIMFHSGMAKQVIDILDSWMGRMPGRLSVLTLVSGTIFATLSGSTIATSGTLGTLLVPEMESRGYHKSMAIGPIMGVGGLAMIIPPSALAVVLGSLGKISIGKLLIGGILPGLLIAALYLSYIIGRCALQPSMAPSYSVDPIPLARKIKHTAKYALPMVLIIVAVLGSIFLGIATPTEAAALGAFMALILSAVYRKLNGKMLSAASLGAVEVTAMVFLIIGGSTAFGFQPDPGLQRGEPGADPGGHQSGCISHADFGGHAVDHLDIGHLHGADFHHDDHLAGLYAGNPCPGV